MKRASGSRPLPGWGGNRLPFHACSALIFLAASLHAQEQSASSVSREVKDVFERARKAVIKIHGSDEHCEFFGTGFFVDPTGTIMTSYAVGGEASNLSVEVEGKKHPARAVFGDPRSGLAILKVDLATAALPLGKSDQLEVATPVITIGYPLDLPKTPSFGMIAGFDRKYLGKPFATSHLRINLPTQRGESGAPVLNLKGEVVGVLECSLENSSSCYALPIDAAQRIYRDYLRFGEVRYGWIGINVSETEKEVEGSRALLIDITEDTPAAEAGIKSGDILLRFGRTDVHEPEDVRDPAFFVTAGDVVPITILRGNEKLTFQVQADLRQRKTATIAPNRSVPLGGESAPENTP
jgi:serine protease Do